MIPIDRPITVLIHADPGLARDSLCSLIASFPYAKIVGVLSLDSELAEEVNDLLPDVVLMDYVTGTGNIELIPALKAVHPDSRFVVVTETMKQKQCAYQYGADDVLLRGCTGQEFTAVFQKYFQHSQAYAATGTASEVNVREVSNESR